MLRLLGCLPVLLLVFIGLIVASSLGVLPKPVNDGVQTVERTVVAMIVSTQLGDAVTLEKLSASEIDLGDNGPQAALQVTLRLAVEGADVDAVAFEVLAKLADHFEGIINLGDRITRVELTVLPLTGGTPLLDVSISREAIVAWRAGEMSDQAFRNSWQ